ncbi:MAG: DUF3106 domain-containing protein [Verrucomicrobiota bacterium]
MSKRIQLRTLQIGLLAAVLGVASSLLADRRYPELKDPFGGRPQKPVSETESAPPPPAPERLQTGDSLQDIDPDLLFEPLDAKDGQAQMEQLHALERFLEMPPEQLARIRVAIERVESMSDAEKEALRERIRSFRGMHEEKIAKIRDAHRHWKKMSREDRHVLHRYMMSLPREESMEIRKTIVGMEREERQQFIAGLVDQAREQDDLGNLPEIRDDRDDKRRKEYRVNRPREGQGSRGNQNRPPPPGQ